MRKKLKKSIKQFGVLFALLYSPAVCGQTINGKVVDAAKNPVFAASIYIKSTPSVGTVSNIKGEFELIADEEQGVLDTLVISCIGYQQKKIPFDMLQNRDFLEIMLYEKSVPINEVTVKTSASLTREFSIKKMDKLSIYMSPVSNGDPLKAISFLPYSTNTSETANTELRGSSADVSRVVLNNVPIYRPIRNTRLDGLGNFSIFNTELIEEQLVYAGNPPLKFSNSIAGLVEIKTIEKLKNPEELRLSLSLASVGASYSKELNNKSFYQLYGNHQFSSAYLKLNDENSSFIHDFSSTDAGLNFHYRLSDRLFTNLYSYFITEEYNSDNFMANYMDNMYSRNIRNFNVANIEYRSPFFSIALNNGTNFMKTNFNFGNFDNQQTEEQIFTSIDSKIFFTKFLSLQTGLSHEYSKEIFSNTLPRYPYAVSPKDSAFSFINPTKMQNTEVYLYGKLLLGNIIGGLGLRKNIPTTDQENYLSFQGNFKYNLSKHHSLLFSAGKYNGYSIPDYLIEDFHQVQSKQFSFEYSFNADQLDINFALYTKKERQPLYYREFDSIRTTNLEIKGIEFSFEYSYERFKFYGSCISLDSHFNVGEEDWYNSYNDMDYLLKASSSYYNQKVFNISLNLTVHPGLYYTPVTGSELDESTENYRPLYGQYNSQHHTSYTSLDLTINKIINYKQSRILVFSTISNLLNKSNQQKIIYNKDYSEISYWNYQKRIIYFGFIITL